MTILVGEELPLIREALVQLCRNQLTCTVTAACADGNEALAQIVGLNPDIAILDLDLPGIHTLEIARRLREDRSNTRVVVLSTRRDRKTVIEALKAGAAGYVLKSGPAQHLKDAVRQIIRGSVYVSPLLEPNKIFAARQKPDVADPLESLSGREYQVFLLMVEGARAKQIAARLQLSPKTVDTYRANLMRKLEIHDVASLVKFAIQRDEAALHEPVAGS